MLTGKRFWLVGIAALVLALAGCSTPTKAHYEADRKYLDGSGKLLLKYADADDKLSADTKAAIHADWNTFDAEVRHGLGEEK